MYYENAIFKNCTLFSNIFSTQSGNIWKSLMSGTPYLGPSVPINVFKSGENQDNGRLWNSSSRANPPTLDAVPMTDAALLPSMAEKLERGKPGDWPDHSTLANDAARSAVHIDGSSSWSRTPFRLLSFIVVVPSPVRREESRALQYLCEETVSQMTFFRHEFWTRQVMQVAHSDECIRHSLVALSSYHESFSSPKQARRNQFALRHYNMSISGILGSPRTAENAHFHLMSCILLICIEVRAVIAHLKAQRGHCLMPVLFFGFADSFLRRIIAQIYMPGELSRSFDFTSLADAQQGLSDIRLQFERCDMRGLVEKVSAWSTAFEECKSLNSAALTSRANRRAVALLELQSRYCAVDIAINCAGHQANQLLWDRYIGAFTEMLDFAEKAMDLQHPDMKGDASCSPQFHMHSGTVPVLYGIIAKFRDPTIRRRAIGLMASCSLQEGVWNNNLVLGVARRIMAIEEGSLGLWPASCIDIPAEPRVRSTAVAAGAGDNQYMVGYQLGRGWWWEGLSWTEAKPH
ncbi:C6 transcription factor, putative [Metarhizium acridum CQMa 102]|uniref:C6 transcription factor, putative n=1 Tax=Metarhizium acridum (strain CQMa 102) TaxID=655827 RepID=E9EH72_METAQ|nr:C6 transcription factor, putative [Metarhizium acridum CQMa 102]EFY84736.1 C6 transcription factor, putative [Metarhizium acridum CQMa 102]